MITTAYLLLNQSVVSPLFSCRLNTDHHVLENSVFCNVASCLAVEMPPVNWVCDSIQIIQTKCKKYPFWIALYNHHTTGAYTWLSMSLNAYNLLLNTWDYWTTFHSMFFQPLSVCCSLWHLSLLFLKSIFTLDSEKSSTWDVCFNCSLWVLLFLVSVFWLSAHPPSDCCLPELPHQNFVSAA